MKLQRRTKLTLLSVVLLCLFAGSLCKGKTKLVGVSYPETVGKGSTFEITVTFDYAVSQDCICGRYFWLNYNVGTDPSTSNPQQLIVMIDSLPDFPRPNSVVIKINTSNIACEVNDTFIFQIKWNRGYSTACTGTIYSEWYKLTIVEPKRISFSVSGIIIPVLILSAVILIRKKKIKN